MKICRENRTKKWVIYMKTNIHFLSYLAHFFLERKLLQTSVVEKLATHILCPLIFFFENRDVYRITWKNIVESDRVQKTIWRMRISCWIPKARNTHTGCVILGASLPQQWLHERASMLRYTYIASLVQCCFQMDFSYSTSELCIIQFHQRKCLLTPLRCTILQT